MTVQAERVDLPTSPRKGRRSGVVSELSVLLKVKPGREQRLRQELTASIADSAQHAEGQKILEDIGTVHEVRYVLFDDDTRLLLATSFDGDWDVYIDDFFRTKVLMYWSSFLIHCEGAPDDLAGAAALSLDDWKEFLSDHQITAIEYRRTYPDLTVKQILKAQQIMTAFQQLLDQAST